MHDKKAGLRPMDWGDVLILVRKRGPMFEEILRALKQRGVPVAGADRLTLSAHPVFRRPAGAGPLRPVSRPTI